VVETSRGAVVKLKYDPPMRAFTQSRTLSLGIAYPFDWGVIAETTCEDGDPLDALAIHDSATYPGVILPCRPLGVGEQNPRLILMPIWHDRMGELEKATGLPARLRDEIKQFTGNDPRIEGWRGPKAAGKLAESCRTKRKAA
jgi:inorganic pyrophosphatase